MPRGLQRAPVPEAGRQPRPGVLRGRGSPAPPATTSRSGSTTARSTSTSTSSTPRTAIPSHMPDAFAEPDWDNARIKRWAADIGPGCAAVVGRIFDRAKLKEQAYNPSLSVLDLSKKYGRGRLETACAHALPRLTSPRYRHIKAILDSGLNSDAGTPASASAELPSMPGGHVRGEREAAGRKGEASLPRRREERDDLRGARHRRGADTRGRHVPVHGARGQRGHRELHRHGQELPGVLHRQAGLRDAQERTIHPPARSAHGARRAGRGRTPRSSRSTPASSC